MQHYTLNIQQDHFIHWPQNFKFWKTKPKTIKRVKDFLLEICKKYKMGGNSAKGKKNHLDYFVGH